MQAAPPEQEVLHVRVTSSFNGYGADYYPYKDLAGALAPGAQVRTVNLPVSQQANPQLGVRSVSSLSRASNLSLKSLIVSPLKLLVLPNPRCLRPPNRRPQAPEVADGRPAIGRRKLPSS